MRMAPVLALLGLLASTQAPTALAGPDDCKLSDYEPSNPLVPGVADVQPGTSGGFVAIWVAGQGKSFDVSCVLKP